ncbi:MAG: Smr/MutS family protein [Oscillospiraceae bacterium]
MSCKVINLEVGLPTVEQAKSRLERELKSAKTSGIEAVKIIHGYGSTGKGGVIKPQIYKVLSQKKKNGEIKAVIKGEDFSPFDEESRKAMRSCPSLSKDTDMSKTNHGITIVVL